MKIMCGHFLKEAYDCSVNVLLIIDESIIMEIQIKITIISI